MLDELEWRSEDQKLSGSEREQRVSDLLALVSAVDGILQLQSKADAGYFTNQLGRRLSDTERSRVEQTFLRAYRYQYIGSGLEMTRFPEILFGMVSEAQGARIRAAVGALL